MNKNIIKTINDLTIQDIIRMEQIQKEAIFKDPNKILQLNETTFLMVFQQLNSQIREELLKHNEVIKRILFTKATKSKRIPFQFLSKNEQDIILQNNQVLLEINEQVLIKILDIITPQQKQELIKNIRENLKYNNINPDNQKLNSIKSIEKNTITIEEFKKNWNFEDEYISMFLTQCRQQKRNPIELLQIKTNNEFIIYVKTNCIIKEKQIKENNIALDLIKNINLKHITNLIQLYKEHLEKNNINISQDKILITSLNVYLIFGYDNARKILLDFYTYPTESSKQNQAILEYNEQRKEYRLTHQDEFYNHNMINKLFQLFVQISNDHSAPEENEFLKKLLQTTNKEKYNSFYTEFTKILHLDSQNRKIELENLLKREISKREEDLKNKYIQETKDINILENQFILHEIFNGLDYKQCQLNNDGTPIINKEITRFFLGNEKKNNDCLLRMILSKNFFDLKEHIIPIINSFNIIKQEIKRSKGNLSINSLIDVIKVYQFTTYSLDYDEQDLSLSTIAKISKSFDFMESDKVDNVKEMLKYHKFRKFKTNLSIPFVKGKTDNNIEYSILENDTEEILTSGIDHRCCFKANAKGEDFFKFCLTNPNGGVILLKNHNNNQSYITPFIVNGNTIYANGIEPRIDRSQIKEIKLLIEAIQEIFNKISLRTIEEPIEIGVITNLNIEKTNVLENYPIITVNSNPANSEFYCDITKPEKNTHIIFKKEENSNIKHYERMSRYEQPRKGIFYYLKNEQQNSADPKFKILERKVNLVYYTYLKLNDELNPQTFAPIDINECNYIIGNNDWFILNKNGETIKCVLPYYKQVEIEMAIASETIKGKDIGEISNDRKSNRI